MNRLIKYTILASLILVSLGVMSFSEVSEVQACSGGGSDNIQDTLANTTYVVKADVVSVDTMRQNAILHVDSYLYGGPGPEYLLFVQNDPVLVNRVINDSPIGNCNFWGSELTPGLSAYFFLSRRPDGVYRISLFERLSNGTQSISISQITTTRYRFTASKKRNTSHTT